MTRFLISLLPGRAAWHCRIQSLLWREGHDWDDVNSRPPACRFCGTTRRA